MMQLKKSKHAPHRNIYKGLFFILLLANCCIVFLFFNLSPQKAQELQPSIRPHIDVCFSPKNNCVADIIKQIEKAKKSVWVQGYSFTSKVIANALVSAHKKGVEVFVLLDKSQEHSPHSMLSVLEENNIPVLIDHLPAISHNKIMLIDNHTLLTGSYNWSNAAEKRNAENILFIENDNTLFQKYKQNFLHRKSLSREPSI